jgi:excisionase family DNA binding protein
MIEKMLTTVDVSRILQVKPHTIRLWTWAGKIPSVKIGRAVRYRADVVERIAKEGLPNPQRG